MDFIDVEETTGKFIMWPFKITEPFKNLPIDLRIKFNILDLTSAHLASVHVLLVLIHNTEVTLTLLRFLEYARPFCFLGLFLLPRGFNCTIRTCYGLNCVPLPHSYIEVLTPQHLRMWSYIEIGLCRCN